jgi:glycosyltransferase involved in cell wall biosynthesis
MGPIRMETILQDSLPNNSDCPQVQVLLATYNGEKYLEDFLKSLLCQDGVRIELIASDDGSSDSTLKIIEKYSNKFHSFTQLEGPGKGPAANFFFLLRHADSDYIALADQDDIWSRFHLINSVSRIAEYRNSAALSFTSVSEFEKTLDDGKIWPEKSIDLNVFSRIFENPARGCTMVINRYALDKINEKSLKANCIMHDWWILLVISLIGNISIEQSPEIYYRLHGNNFTKESRLSLHRVRRVIKWRKKTITPITQLINVLDLYDDKIILPLKIEITSFLQSINSYSFFRRMLLCLNFKHRLRQSITENILVKILIVFRYYS